MICQCCKINEATSKRRPLCKYCYKELHKEGMLHLFPLLNNNFEDKLIKKYGPDIINDLKNIAENNLRIVGEKYGFTREYTRQIYEKAMGFKYTVIKNHRSSKLKAVRQAVSNLKKDPRYKTSVYSPTCTIGKGADAEKKVFDICAQLGYEIKPYHDLSIDLVINGFLVDIKSCYKPRFTNKCHVTPYDHFKFSEKQRQCDFIVCYSATTNQFFVIPQKSLKGNEIWIPIKKQSSWSNSSRRNTNHWYDYLEAWHLLKPKQDVMSFNQLLEAPASTNSTTQAVNAPAEDRLESSNQFIETETSYQESIPCMDEDWGAVSVTDGVGIPQSVFGISLPRNGRTDTAALA